MVDAQTKMKDFTLWVSKQNAIIHDRRLQIQLNFKLQGDQEFEMAKSLFQDNLYSLQESFMEFDYPNIVSKLFILTTELERYKHGHHKFVIRENEVRRMTKQCEDAL